MNRKRVASFLLLFAWTWVETSSVQAWAGAEPAAHGTAAKHAKKHNAFSHVSDTDSWQFFDSFGPELKLGYVSKFMILEVIAAALILAIYIPMARRLQSGARPQGGWDNAFESLLTFIRNEVARPNLGEHDADKHVPFLWTIFLFVLFCNLLGMIPFLGSPTASIWVTGALALCSFVGVQFAAVAKMGPVHYVKSLWPHMDLPFGMGYILKPMIFVIEVFGIFIKSSVLAVRLFANMFAGHMVLASIMLFIVMGANLFFGLWLTITVSSVLGVVALSLLELFVAFLQAYIFVFLTALFMGMALHPQH